MFKKMFLRNFFVILFIGMFFIPIQFSYADYDSFTVNVSDAQGGYIAVVLKQSGTGYVGPRGEYYANFPKVSELQAVYGAGDAVQREQMLRKQMDDQVQASQQRMIQQQQLMNEQIQQNIQRQQARAVSSALILNTSPQPQQNYFWAALAVLATWAGWLILLFCLLGIIGFALYFLPTIIALSRQHKNFVPILILNIFLGVTLIGWVVALVWSFSHQEKK